MAGYKGINAGKSYDPKWGIIRRRVLTKAKWKCEVQLKGCIHAANEVDHIDQNIENNELDNLRAVCTFCHRKITAEHAQEARLIKNPRKDDDVAHPAVLKKVEKKLTVVDDLPTDDEDKWFTSFGPVYEKLNDGKYVKPDKTLGVHVINWMVRNLQIKGKPFFPTKTQARIIMWMYALDTKGRWLYNRTLHIAPKGWGKDPFGAALCCIELAGPARFKEWDKNGNPVPRRVEEAWVQIAAVKLDQNENTMHYLKDMFTPEAVQRYNIEVQARFIHAFNRRSKIQTISSASSGLEGNFPTFAMMSETQHWFDSNGCKALYRVLKRNLDKVSDSHFYMTTNAYNPNEGSVAQEQFEAWEEAFSGRTKPSKTLLVFLAATHKAPYDTMEQRMKVLNTVYGESAKFTDIVPFAENFDDASQPIQETLRFNYNLIGIESDVWIDIREWDKCINRELVEAKDLPRGTKIVLALDCSKNDDATGLVGMVTEGKYAKTLVKFGVWEKPKSLRTKNEEWKVPREEVDAAVRDVFKRFRVQGFWADPSHRQDDAGGSYWLPLLNEWHRSFNRRIPGTMWAKGNDHAINFDMTSHANQKIFTDGLKALEQEIADNTIRHDGDKDLRRHLQNARRFKSKRFGETISKESPQSAKKIDLAVTAVIAYCLYVSLMTNKRTTSTQMKAYQPS